MVYSGAGISYTELKAMDLAEYMEAYEARVQYDRDTTPNIKGRRRR